ncbi:formyltetrahydrofolate deformylase [Reinekea thalattae]|uniref:Formyltetrahydrofolate deformylase n=1 Tax=Reinekea thalattae TaxID=2593301 RepID=A0A5C8Z8I6_9GAMM|nr:formyltetrahydrofolate deformylase [Reinekea thalattae]TXR53166.1 formyltetrahydrofolate deformylase [Reinekea thalattae]
MAAESQSIILKINCPAGRGIVSAVSSYLSEQGCYISELAHYDDQDSGQLFLRASFQPQVKPLGIDELREGFKSVAEEFSMKWDMHDESAPVKTILMVSKFDHCLDDLLFRIRKGELNLEITAVVSNHLDLRPMAEREGYRYIYLPVNKENKPEQEAALLEAFNETDSELVVLARYMQVLSNNLCTQLRGQAINIHHSFLPGFKGAKPYHQAYDRGVKLIGATAHYVTADLDEGPIIDQAVQPVDHTYSPEQLVAVGRDTETVALARAVKLHAERRVFLDGNKTVIFK